MWESIETGSWLDVRRLRVYPRMLLGFSVLAVIAMLATSDGKLDFAGRPLGTDFSQVWVAGLETLRGHPEEPFDVFRHIAEQHAQFGEKSDVYGWHYPPLFLAPAALLALLPYLEALVLWQFWTLVLYLGAIFVILRRSGLDARRTAIAAIAFPAVLINLLHGQNGFLTAALLGFGLSLLERRPALAGICLGLLAYKPQFGIVLPIALIAGRHWRAIFAASTTVLAVTFASLAAFGSKTWAAFLAGLAFTREVVIEQGATGFEKIQSIFAAVRLLGGDVSTAYAAQGIVAFAALAAIAFLWKSNAEARDKAAAAIAATLLTTPYCLDYDLVALGPAIAFLVDRGLERGFRPFEKSALAVAYLTPLVARPLAMAVSLPFGVSIAALLFALTVRNARRAALATRSCIEK